MSVQILTPYERSDLPFPGKIVGVVQFFRNKNEKAFVKQPKVNDGSCLSNMQCMINSDVQGHDQIISGFVTTGASVWVEGVLVESQGSKQEVELKVKKLDTVGQSDPSFPIQKKMASREYLRTVAHLHRPHRARDCPQRKEMNAVIQEPHEESQALPRIYRGFRLQSGYRPRLAWQSSREDHEVITDPRAGRSQARAGRRCWPQVAGRSWPQVAGRGRQRLAATGRPQAMASRDRQWPTGCNDGLQVWPRPAWLREANAVADDDAEGAGMGDPPGRC
ncbi:Asparagine--tRNA ligase [Nymphaea thermarum]|nr:Asparagine--tRNA ligase [Nymphaea thermarum]